MRSTGDETLEAWARDITVRDVNREAHLPTAIEQLRQFRDAIIKEQRAKSVSVEPYPETVRMASSHLRTDAVERRSGRGAQRRRSFMGGAVSQGAREFYSARSQPRRRADVAILVKRGVHPRDIADRLGVAERTIWRDLDALGIKVPRR